MTLKDRAFDTGSNLRGVAYHPAANGRVITLDAPYELPEGMDLRGIAGVVLKRTQNADAAAEINTMSQDDLAALRRHSGVYDGKSFSQIEPMGPHPAPPYAPPECLAREITELADAFHRLTKSPKITAWFPNAPAPTFHADGVMTRTPSWRLTYAFTGEQTVWHTYRRNENTPVLNRGGVGFPVIPEPETGKKGTDYFSSEGALMFLFNSPNALFHATPPAQNDRRFVITLDGFAPRREGCERSCPFPCREGFNPKP